MKSIIKILAGIFGMMMLLNAQNVNAQTQKPALVYVVAKEYGSGKTIVSYPFSGKCSNMFYGNANIINEYKTEYSRRYDGKFLNSVIIRGPYTSWDDAREEYDVELEKNLGFSPFPFGLKCNMGKQ